MENYRRKYTPRYPDFGECLDQFGEPDRRRLDIIIKEIRKTESETKTWDSDRRNAEISARYRELNEMFRQRARALQEFGIFPNVTVITEKANSIRAEKLPLLSLRIPEDVVKQHLYLTTEGRVIEASTIDGIVDLTRSTEITGEHLLDIAYSVRVAIEERMLNMQKTAHNVKINPFSPLFVQDRK